VNVNLYGLRDPSSGQAGTRSGDAVATLQTIPGADLTDVNLFTMTALINNLGVAAAKQQFLAHSTNGVLDQTYVNDILAANDIIANTNDPLFNFAETIPVNNESARIYGFEIAGQHFFGNTGFGVAGSYTSVNGDIGIDVGADPSVNQFALLGLSDT